MDDLIDGGAVALLGTMVGLGELVSRYRDAPSRALATWPAVFYVVLNLTAAVAALALTRTFGWTFGVTAGNSGEAIRWIQVLVAGLGAMALFRSSLFSVRVGNQDIAVGPSSFLQIFLAAADRAVDRLRAQERATTVRRAMEGLPFAKAYAALPAYCLALMQNLPNEDQEELGNRIKELSTADLGDAIKALILGLALMDAVGADVLTAAVTSLRSELAANQDPMAGGVPPVLGSGLHDSRRDT